MEHYFQQALSGHSPLAWLFAYLAGVLSVATPCVLPMVTLTLAAIGVTDRTTRARAFGRSAVYVAGMITMYSALGLIFGLSGKLFGSLLANRGVAIGLALVLAVFAVSSFELLVLQLPSGLQSKLASVRGKGIFGIFAIGLVSGLLALPCTGPVLGGILTFVATTRDAVTGFLLLALYALGFGTPFLVVGTLALQLPRGGPWMRYVKNLFGLGLLLAAFWILRGAFPELQGTGSVVTGLIMAALGLMAGAIHGSFEGSLARKLRMGVAVLVTAVGGSLAMNALLHSEDAGWCAESPEHPCLPAVCERHDVTVVDFHAEWCGWCKELDKVTLADPNVQRRLAPYGKVQVDVSNKGNAALTDRHGVAGIPTIIFLDRQCRPLPQRIEGYVDPEEFIQTLDDLAKNKSVAAVRHGMKDVPTFFTLDRQCRPLPQRIEGYVPPDEFIQVLDELP